MPIGLNFSEILTNGIVKTYYYWYFCHSIYFLIWNLMLLWILEKIKCNPYFKKMLMASIKLFVLISPRIQGIVVLRKIQNYVHIASYIM